MARYAGIVGKSCKYGDIEAAAIGDGSATLIHLMINDTTFTLSEEQTGQLLEAVGAVTEWHPRDD
jgi:hypothetical protein